MATLSIFTPTYNRAHLLPQLYASLCSQTNKDFVWLLVDDGSTDGTEALVEQLKAENKIAIQYIHQSNGGKHRAHNTAVKACVTPWFVGVDSDDYMVDDAVEVILTRIERLGGLAAPKRLGGLAAPREQSTSQNTAVFADGDESSLIGLYRRGFVGETTLVYRTDLLRAYPYPEFEGEHFVTEAVVYDKIDKEHVLSLLAKPLVVCEYQPDGYSMNEKRLFVQNPKGWAYRFNQRAQNTQTWKERYVCCAKYVCFSMIARQHWLRKANYKALSVLAIPLAIIYKNTRYKL